MLENNGSVIKDDKKIANIFNDLFVHIIERTTDKSVEALDENETIENIILKYKDHSSIRSIESTMNGQTFSMPLADEDGVYNILRNLNPKKAPGSDIIPPKLAKHAALILSRPLSHIINATIEKQTFPSSAKINQCKTNI